MDGNESERIELIDFKIGRECVFAALAEGQIDTVTDLLEHGHKDLKLLTMELFRRAFKKDDIAMIEALMPFGKERDEEVRNSILEDAVKIGNADIINMIYKGLEISGETLGSKLYDKVIEYCPEIFVGGTDSVVISPASLTNLLRSGQPFPEILTAPIDQVREITADLVEAVIESEDNELIYMLAERISTEGFRKEHSALFPWLKENWPDPELIEQLNELENTPESPEE